MRQSGMAAHGGGSAPRARARDQPSSSSVSWLPQKQQLQPEVNHPRIYGFVSSLLFSLPVPNFFHLWSPSLLADGSSCCSLAHGGAAAVPRGSPHGAARRASSKHHHISICKSPVLLSLSLSISLCFSITWGCWSRTCCNEPIWW
jgi:hypothetical protein